jgi:20S proteasome subunit alpha 3
MKIADALDLSIKVLSKTLDMNKLTPDKIEIATLRRINGKTVIGIMPNDEMTKLIQKFEASEKAAEEAKKEKELQQKADAK